MRAWVFLPILLAGCTEVTPSGGVFQPVVEAPPVAVSATPAPAPEGSFDFDEDARDEGEEGSAEPDPDGEPVSLAAALGLPEPEPTEPEPEPEPEALAPAAPAWTPATPISGEWGVRVISTTPQAQPPVAVLGFASGPDLAVHPGDLLAQHGIVVMAIGKDAVQIARVSPAGDHAKVTSEVVPILSRPPLTLSLQ